MNYDKLQTAFIIIGILLIFALVLHVIRQKEMYNKIVQVAQADQTLFSKLNELRIDNGVGLLEYDIKLEASGYKHCKEIQRTGFKHGNWAEIAKRYTKAALIGENLAQGFSKDTVLEAWWESPSHKRNLLNNKFNKAGIYTCGDITILQLSN